MISDKLLWSKKEVMIFSTKNTKKVVKYLNKKEKVPKKW